MVQIDAAMEGFRTVMVTALGIEDVYFQDDDFEWTGVQKCVIITWDMVSKPCGVGGDYLWEFSLILECYFKNGQDPLVNYKTQADIFFEEVLVALSNRDNLDQFLRRASLKLIGDKNIRSYPFPYDTPGQHKKVITVRGYIHNTQT